MELAWILDPPTIALVVAGLGIAAGVGIAGAWPRLEVATSALGGALLMFSISWGRVIGGDAFAAVAVAAISGSLATRAIERARSHAGARSRT